MKMFTIVGKGKNGKLFFQGYWKNGLEVKSFKIDTLALPLERDGKVIDLDIDRVITAEEFKELTGNLN